MMGANTGIAWTDRTWNPHQGCRKVSAGCKFCYMFRDKARYGQDPGDIHRSSPHTFNAPLSKKWASPARVFVCSWSDFFIEEADAWRAEEWDIIRRAKHLTFQILTKRPERIAASLPPDWGNGWPHVWLGVTVEDRAALPRLDYLRDAPAAVRFASFEPLLEPLGEIALLLAVAKIDWGIIGAESGPHARYLPESTAYDLVVDCIEAGTAPFVKQLHWLSNKHGQQLVTDPSDPRWPDWGVRLFPEVP
jgi:protein gp37